MVTRLAGLSERTFDVIVIGGGITGCGVAREAVMRGLRVALFEKGDFASGTSSRSSRLIHGGVRYLEHGYLRLVFEASAERRRLLRLAPHLVQPLEFTWPVYRGARVPRWKLGAGLTLYDLLAMFRNVGRHHRLSRDEVVRLQPTLRQPGLIGGATYFDAHTNDTRLTLAVALDARDRGAALHNHARVVRLLEEGGKTIGVEVRDELSGKSTEVRAASIVNASGPWSDAIRRLEGGSSGSGVHGSKGVHIAVDRDRIGNHGALTLLSPDDGRVMFALPAEHQTIFGTTDTFTSVTADEVRASESDVAYLLAAANSFFPEARLHRDDVIAAWAGVRPLASGGAAGSSVSASREHSIVVTRTGVVTITGGKLTTFRIMAEQTVDAVLQHLAKSAPASHSDRTPIEWGATSLSVAIAEAVEETNDVDAIPHFVITYGNKWRAAREAIRSIIGGEERVDPAFAWRMGELAYACDAEMARTLGDLLIRRTNLAYQLRDNGRSLAPRVAQFVAGRLGWTERTMVTEIERYEAEVARIFTIDPA